MDKQNRFLLQNQVAIITGAASGLGMAISEILAEWGAHVVISDIDQQRIDNVVAGIEKSGGSAEGLFLDVTNRASIHEAVDAVVKNHGHVDIMVANAGMSAGPGYETDAGQINAVEDERWDKVLDINLSGVFTSIQAAAKHMKKQKSGSIVAISSVAGLRSEALCGYAYVATKAAVVNLVRQISMELAPYNVRINGIAPGPFRTNFADGRLRESGVEEQFRDMVPLQRIASPDEIKGLALLLCSPASSFMTGTTIPIDGGIMAR